MTDTIRSNNADKAGLFCSSGPAETGIPIFSWFSVSTFSPVKQDMWVRGYDHNYQIVLLPGYQKPRALDMQSIDSVWYEGIVNQPTSVWDGSSQVGLFEIISECFDPHGEMRPYIKVMEKSTGKYVDDTRSDDILRDRPIARLTGDILSPERQILRRKHIKDVQDFYTDRSINGPGSLSSLCPDMYLTSAREARFYPANVRQGIMWHHPNGSDENIMDASGKPRLVVPEMRFGYGNYLAEKARYPEWHENKLRLDHEIARGLYSDEATIARKKRTLGIPRSSREDELLKREEWARETKDDNRGILRKLFNI